MVRSAGLGALVGQPPDPLAVQLMLERGIDIARHRAVQINRPMCIESDIVLVMDSEQRRRLQQLYPEVHGRVFRLGEYLERDVPDPFRQPIAAFRNAFSLIEDSIDHWLGRFRRL
jgi:protein-tyrosine phosphatase